MTPYMDVSEGADLLQGFLVALIFLIIITVTGVQLYKWGQRHPDPAKFTSYASAVALANEREQVGYRACLESF